MRAGNRFNITSATVALEANNGMRSLVTIPQGAVVEVTCGPPVEGMGTVAVLWEGRILAMFAVDIEKRGTAFAEANSQSAHA